MSYILQSNAMSSKILYIDSRDASSFLAQKTKRNFDGTDIVVDLTSYFQYTIKEKIEVPLNQRCLVSLNGATIPYSFYNIRSGINNILFIRAVNNSDGAPEFDFREVLFQIPEGNYTAYTFAELIENVVNGTSIQDSLKGILFKFQMDYDTDLGMYKYTMTRRTEDIANNEIKLSFVFVNNVAVEGFSPHIEMGFTGKEDITWTLLTNGSAVSVYSQNVVDLNGSIHGVYVRTNLVSNGTLDTQSGTFSNILSRIPINVASGGIIFATPNNDTHRSIVDIRSIDTITIRLTDERNRILDLNGLHFQIAISLDFIYAKRKQNIPMGSLSESIKGHSHIEDIQSRMDKRVENENKQNEINSVILEKLTKINESTTKKK